MNVGDLIAALSSYPSEMPVLVHADWDGFEDVASVFTESVHLNARSDSFCGPHLEDWRRIGGGTQVVVVSWHKEDA